MKKLLLACAALTLVASGALAANEIGIFTTQDANPDNAVYNGAPGQVTAYVVLTDAFNDNIGSPIGTVGGFEFRVVLPANTFLLTTTLPPATTNFASSPDFLCGTNIPTVDGRCTLLTLGIGAFDLTPREVRLTPVQFAPQSVPGEMAITDFADDFSISVAYPISGSHDLPVFGMWTSVVPTEDASWGQVKSLFR